MIAGSFLLLYFSFLPLLLFKILPLTELLSDVYAMVSVCIKFHVLGTWSLNVALLGGGIFRG
jgi:hypothetical protein